MLTQSMLYPPCMCPGPSVSPCIPPSGDIPEGSFVLNHPAVQHVHMTGGAPTHDTIVWGVGKEAQAANKATTTHPRERERPAQGLARLPD